VPKGADSLTGLGWPFEVAEFLCAEYGWLFADALALPVATALALMTASHQRNGGKFRGMDWMQRIAARKIREKKHHG
jgi:hypothetical protein